MVGVDAVVRGAPALTANGKIALGGVYGRDHKGRHAAIDIAGMAGGE